VTDESDTGAGLPARRAGISPVRTALAVGLALALALGGLCGWLGHRVYQARQSDQLRELFIETGKKGAVNLTTIDHTRAEADVNRILDSATGAFRDDFASRSGPFIDVVQKARSTSSGTVTEAGLESVDGDEGQVLVAVTVATTSLDVSDQPLRYWRMRLTVRKVDDGAKIAKVDFVS
jgi:Mce-associated membrane protein